MSAYGRLITLGFLAFLVVLPFRAAEAQLFWDLSVKFIDDSSGTPGNCQGVSASNDSEAEILAAVAYANSALDRMGRGYRFRLTDQGGGALTSVISPTVTPPANVGTSWEFANLSDDTLVALENQAPLSTCVGGLSPGAVCTLDSQCFPSTCENQFRFDPNALNIYMLSTCGGGRSATRDVGRELPVVIIGQNAQGSQTRLFHEVGHAIGICHPHGCPNAVNGTRNASCLAEKATSCASDPGDDAFGDTSCDCPSWDDEDVLADKEYNQSYVSLSSPQQDRVLDVLFNVMSYHQDNDFAFLSEGVTCSTDGLDEIGPGCTVNVQGGATDYSVFCPDPANPGAMIEVATPCRHRLTDDQLDRAIDRTNCLYPQVANGRTWFVGSNPGWNPLECDAVPSSSSIPLALTRAAPGEVLMLWPGTYTGELHLTSPISLRASRGTATLRP